MRVNKPKFLLFADSLQTLSWYKEKLSENEYIHGHYRRFLCINETLEELVSLGFKIIVAQEGSDYSPMIDSNPTLIRIIAKINI